MEDKAWNLKIREDPYIAPAILTTLFRKKLKYWCINISLDFKYGILYTLGHHFNENPHVIALNGQEVPSSTTMLVRL